MSERQKEGLALVGTLIAGGVLVVFVTFIESGGTIGLSIVRGLYLLGVG